MQAAFDPYHKWLGIPRSEQPPHLYRLLGLQLFEADADVIAYAADQRMALLKTFAAGVHGAISEDLLNEVARAKVWLLNPEKRTRYDSQLREQLLSPSTTVPSSSSPTSQSTSNGDSSLVFHSPAPAKVYVEPPANTNGTNAVMPPNAVGAVTHPDTAWVDERISLTDQSPNALQSPRRKSTTSPVTLLLMTAITGVIGSLAGYFMLCIIDMRYDFLHLLNTGNSQQLSRSENNRNSHVPPQNRRLNPPNEEEPNQDNSPKRRTPPGTPEQRRNTPRKPTPRPEPKSTPPPNDPPLESPSESNSNPFAKLPPTLSLPRPNTFGAPVPLIVIPTEHLTDFSIELLEAGDVKILDLHQKDKDSPTRHWRLTRANASREIAAFDVKNNDLLFEWYSGTNAFDVVELRNAVLKMTANGHEYFACLREPQPAEPLLLDFNMATNRAICEVDDLPDISDICVDIVDVQNSPKYSVDGQGLLKLKLNDEVILRFGQFGIATKIGVSRFRDRPAIELITRYKLPSGFEDEMDSRRANRKLQSLRRTYAAKNDDATKADIDALERVSKLAEQLHERVTHRYRFYFFVDGHEVVLSSSK